MSPSEIGAQALAADEREITSVTLLRDGLTNDSWLVRTASDAVVVRINNPNAQVLQVDRHLEAEILSIVGRAGIGPEVLLCDPSRHVLVTRYLGATCKPADMHQPARIEAVARLLRRLHDLPPPSSIGEVRWTDVMNRYLATLTTLNRETPLLCDEALQRARTIAKELEAMSERSCLCHNDVHYLNLIDTGRLTLLDWEYAGVGDPYFDLASVAFYNELDMSERAMLLSSYEDVATPSALQRLAKTCIVFEYVHDLWHEVRRVIGDDQESDGSAVGQRERVGR